MDTWSVALGFKGKNALKCHLDLGGEKAIRVLATHLPVGRGAAAVPRLAPAKIGARRSVGAAPLFVLGDLNDDLAPLFTAADFHLPASAPWTFPAPQPRRTIDWILPPVSWRSLGVTSPRTAASDHLPALHVAFPP